MLPLLVSSAAFPAGKAPTPDPGNKIAPVCTDTSITPSPARPVILKPVGTLPFQLPNGATVDMTADLNAIFESVVAETNLFRPSDPAPGAPGTGDPCGVHLELRPKVSVMSLNAWQFGVTFGYSPTGALPTVTSLTAQADVKISTIAMEFSLWQCMNGGCQALVSSTATQSTASVAASVTIDFGTVTTSPSLIYNSPLGNVLRAIMKNGMAQVVASPNLSELPWSATVREASQSSGTLTFDSGSNSLIKAGQTFVAYAVTPSTGACGVFQAVAELHTTQVFPVSSDALIDKQLNSRGVLAGDIVMVMPAAASPPSAP